MMIANRDRGVQPDEREDTDTARESRFPSSSAHQADVSFTVEHKLIIEGIQHAAHHFGGIVMPCPGDNRNGM
jgi:hypothetical protein